MCEPGFVHVVRKFYWKGHVRIDRGQVNLISSESFPQSVDKIKSDTLEQRRIILKTGVRSQPENNREAFQKTICYQKFDFHNPTAVVSSLSNKLHEVYVKYINYTKQFR